MHVYLKYVFQNFYSFITKANHLIFKLGKRIEQTLQKPKCILLSTLKIFNSVTLGKYKLKLQ